MAKISTLQGLLVDELQDLYDAERQLVVSLPRMAGAAHDGDLRAAIAGHLEETKEHVRRLEQALVLLMSEPRRKPCAAMRGLLAEARRRMRLNAAPSLRDAALVCSAQKIEHYEIASYGTARTFATNLGYSELAALLQQTLDEEGAADKKLTELARSLNPRAKADAGTEKAPPPKRGLLGKLRALIPGATAAASLPARRPKALLVTEIEFLRTPQPKRATRSAAPRKKSKRRRTRAGRTPTKRANSSRRKPVAQRKPPPRTRR